MSILFGSGWGGGAPLLSLTPYAHRFCLQQKIGQLGSGRFCWWMFRCLYAGTCGQYMEGGPFGTSGEFYSSAELRDIEPDHTSEEDPSRLAWLQSYTGEAVVWLCRRPTCPSRYFQPPSLDERAFASEHRWEIPAARSRLDDIPTGDEFADEERQRSTEQGDATLWEEFDIPSELTEPEHDGVGPEFGSDPEPEEGGVGPPSLGDIESADDGAGYWESLAAISMQQSDVATQPIVPKAKAWRHYVADGRTIEGEHPPQQPLGQQLTSWGAQGTTSGIRQDEARQVAENQLGAKNRKGGVTAKVDIADLPSGAQVTGAKKRRRESGPGVPCTTRASMASEEAQGGASKARITGVEEKATVDEAELEEIAMWNKKMSKIKEVRETAFGEVGALEPATEHSEDCQDELEVIEECSSLAVQLPFDELEASLESVPSLGRLVGLRLGPSSAAAVPRLDSMKNRRLQEFRLANGMDDMVRSSVEECYREPIAYSLVSVLGQGGFLPELAANGTVNSTAQLNAKEQADAEAGDPWQTEIEPQGDHVEAQAALPESSATESGSDDTHQGMQKEVGHLQEEWEQPEVSIGVLEEAVAVVDTPLAVQACQRFFVKGMTGRLHVLRKVNEERFA